MVRKNTFHNFSPPKYTESCLMAQHVVSLSEFPVCSWGYIFWSCCIKCFIVSIKATWLILLNKYYHNEFMSSCPIHNKIIIDISKYICVFLLPPSSLFHFLDSTYKWYHMILVLSVWLTSLSMIISRFHPCYYKWHYFILFMSE